MILYSLVIFQFNQCCTKLKIVKPRNIYEETYHIKTYEETYEETYQSLVLPLISIEFDILRMKSNNDNEFVQVFFGCNRIVCTVCLIFKHFSLLSREKKKNNIKS